MVTEVAANFLGETLSDFGGLDTIADGVALAGDSSQSLKWRAWGVAKATAVSVLDVTGAVAAKQAVGGAIGNPALAVPDKPFPQGVDITNVIAVPPNQSLYFYRAAGASCSGMEGP